MAIHLPCIVVRYIPLNVKPDTLLDIQASSKSFGWKDDFSLQTLRRGVVEGHILYKDLLAKWQPVAGHAHMWQLKIMVACARQDVCIKKKWRPRKK